MKKQFNLLSCILLTIATVAVLGATILTATIPAAAESNAQTETDSASDGRYRIAETSDFRPTTDSSIFGVPAVFAVKFNESYIRLGADGSFQMRFLFNSGLLALGGIDLSAFNLSAIVDQYAVELLPGFTLDDLQSSLLLAKSLGLSFIGLDFDDPDIQAIARSLAQTGTLPPDMALPDGIGFEVNTTYYLKDVYGADGTKYVGCFVGAHGQYGEPFFIFTLGTDSETQKDTLIGKILFMQTVIATEKITKPSKS